MNDNASFGVKFLDSDIVDEDSDIHVFSPIISIISFELNGKREKIRIEIPQSSVYSQALPLEYITDILSPELM